MTPWLLLVLLMSLQTGCGVVNFRLESASGAPHRIIDAHIHTAFDGQPARASGILYTAHQLAQEMAAHHVVGFVSHTANLHQPLPARPAPLTAYCAGITAQYDPAALDAALARGTYHCLKVYLGYVPRYASDPNAIKLRLRH